ncbi:hypothetical protein CDV26_06350 [Francisella halioticida]|uniref:Uncharacterized protein n=1 Tax=Francisella halioticida TaxID=549298 RepID=A0ABM6LZY5_9GAMM|nr:hypothetical protein CDV26_06350 [Francisella halioticida]
MVLNNRDSLYFHIQSSQEYLIAVVTFLMSTGTIKATLFMASILWSILLLYKVIKQIPRLNIIKITLIGSMLFVNLLVISYIWWPAIFDKTYVFILPK